MASNNEQTERERTPMNRLTRNFLHLNCPSCGEVCSIQSSRAIQERGSDALVQCRNIECGYRGAVQVSYGPVLEANNPKPQTEGQRKLQPGVRNSFLKILCPHCESVCRVRTSVQMIRAQRQLYVFCQDADHCGYRGVVFLTHTDRLSLDPEGNLREIPLSPDVREQCQFEIDLAYEKFQPRKGPTK